MVHIVSTPSVSLAYSKTQGVSFGLGMWMKFLLRYIITYEDLGVPE